MADKRVIKTGFRKVLTDSLRDCQRVNSNHPITLIMKSQEPKSRLISIKTAPVQKGHSLLSSYVAKNISYENFWYNNSNTNSNLFSNDAETQM